MFYKTLTIWKIRLGLVITWRQWDLGLGIILSSDPDIHLNLGPLHFWIEYYDCN